jgi:hypothetical protein
MTMELSSLITANVLQQGVKGVEARVAAYGDPADYHRRRLLVADAVLKAAGVYEGKPIDPTSLATLDVHLAAIGLLSARDPLMALGDCVTAIGHVARALGGEAVIAAVANAVEGEPKAGEGEHPDEGLSRLARRLRPIDGGPP